MLQFEVTAAARFDDLHTPRLTELAHQAYTDFTRFALAHHDLALSLWSDESGRARFAYQAPDDWDLNLELGDAAEFLHLGDPAPVPLCPCGPGSLVHRRLRSIDIGGRSGRPTLLPLAPTADARYRIPVVEPLTVEARTTRWAATLDRLAETGGHVRVAFTRRWPDENEQAYAATSLEVLGRGQSVPLDAAAASQLRALASGAPQVTVSVCASPAMQAWARRAFLRDLPVAPLTGDNADAQLGLGGSSTINHHIERRATTFSPEEAAHLALPPSLRTGTVSPMPSYVATAIPRASARSTPIADDELVVRIGEVRGEPVVVPAVSLTRHVFVTGTTGSGKTTTIGNLAEQVAALPGDAVPVTLIDPLQGRFAQIADDIHATRVDLAAGDLTARFNPFLPAVKAGAYQHCEIVTQTLALVFPTNRVAFDLLGAMVKHLYLYRHLASCRECGNDPGAAWNHFLGVTGGHLREHRDQIPVIDDLITISPAFLKTIKGPDEFSTEWFRDTEGHFAQRWDGLRKSALYRVFGGGEPELSRHLTALRSPGRWWGKRILIELGAGFSDGERDALTLLLFSLLCQHYRSKALERESQGETGDQLRHLAVVDEAHRLAPAILALGGEILSAREALSRFVEQMVAEARADGLGLVFADQSLLAVSEGLLVNTGTKIIQLVVHGAERAAVAESIGLDTEGSAYLARLAADGEVRREVVFVSPHHPEPARMDVVRRRLRR